MENKFDYIKTEWRKLGAIGFIIIGAFLIIEHIYSYGYVSFFDFLGHEWFGVIFILLGFLIAGRNNIAKPFSYAKEKIKYALGNRPLQKKNKR